MSEQPDDFAAACAWADFREDFGVSADDRVREREHRAFIAGFEAARSNDDRGSMHPAPTADREATAEETGYRVGALPPYSVTHIDGDYLGIGGGHRWHVMGTVDGSPRNPQGPVAVCEWEPSAHAIAALLNAPTADRDEVADAIELSGGLPSSGNDQVDLGNARHIADALLARFEMRRKV